MWTTRGWRISGWRWKTFAKHLWTKVNTDDVLNRAAILSFYFLLALFPLLLFLTALWVTSRTLNGVAPESTHLSERNCARLSF